MTFIATSSSSYSFSHMLSLSLCTAPASMHAFADSSGETYLHGSPCAFQAAGCFYDGDEAQRDADIHFFTNEEIPDRITPENAHRFPELLREIEDLESTINRAKDPWSRGVVSMFLLAHSGRFAEYVTQNGHLSETGRNFLANLKGKDRVIDPVDVAEKRKTDTASSVTIAENKTQPTEPTKPVATERSTPAVKETDPPGVLYYKLTSLLRGRYGYSVDMVSGPNDLSVRLIAEPELIPIAVELLDDLDDNIVEATTVALEYAAYDSAVDITPALPIFFSRLHQDEEHTYARAIRSALDNPKSREKALAMLTPFLSSKSSDQRMAGYRCLERARSQELLAMQARGLEDTDPNVRKEIYEVLARSPNAPLTMLARGLADDDRGVRTFIRKELIELTKDPGASTEAYSAAADMLFHRGSRFARKEAAIVFEQASRETSIAASDQLVAALGDSNIAVPITRALISGARHIESRSSVYDELLKGLALESVVTRANVSAIIVKLLNDEKVSTNTELWLLKAATHSNANVRSGIAIAYGKAAKEGRPLSREERDMLTNFEHDRDGNVRSQAKWALEQDSNNTPIEQNTTTRVDASKNDAVPDKTEEPMAIDEQIALLRTERDQEQWHRLRSVLSKSLLEVSGDERTELLRETLMHETEYYGPMRTAEIYSDIASLVSISSDEILMLLERRMTGWSDLRDLLDSSLNSARAATGSNGFLSRDAYFDIMEQSVKGKLGERVNAIAQKLLQRAASNGDTRARDLLSNQENPSASPPQTAPSGHTTQKPKPNASLDPANLTPEAIVHLFSSDSDETIEGKVEVWLDSAESDSARRDAIISSMIQALRLTIDDPGTLTSILDFLELFSSERLLGKEDYATLMELWKESGDATVRDEIDLLLSNAEEDSRTRPLVQAAEADLKRKKAGKTESDTSLVLDPEKIRNMFFLDGTPAGQQLIKKRVDEWLAMAKQNPHAAHRIREAMRRVAQLDGNDPLTIQAIVERYFKRFLDSNLLRQEDMELLMELQEATWLWDSSAAHLIGQILEEARATPKLARLAGDARERRKTGRSETAPRLDPETLAREFGTGIQFAHERSDALIKLIKEDSSMAPQVRSAMWNAVELAESNDSALQNILFYFFYQAAMKHLLTEEDCRQLRALEERYPARVIRDCLLLASKKDTEKEAPVSAPEMDPVYRTRKSGFFPMENIPPERKARIEKLANELLFGDKKKHKKAAAAWAKAVGDGKAETIALPVLEGILSNSDTDETYRTLAIEALVKAAAKSGNWPEKKSVLFFALLRSDNPVVRANAAKAVGLLAAALPEMRSQARRNMEWIIEHEEDDLVKAAAEQALQSINSTPA